MGEAKQRGTYAQRKAAAIKRDALCRVELVAAPKEATPEDRKRAIKQVQLIAIAMSMASGLRYTKPDWL